jgi:hypothetical protein
MQDHLESSNQLHDVEERSFHEKAHDNGHNNEEYHELEGAINTIIDILHIQGVWHLLFDRFPQGPVLLWQTHVQAWGVKDIS